MKRIMEPRVQDARIALLQTYSSQLISHGTHLLGVIIVIFALIEIKLTLNGQFIGWWILLAGFICGSIYLLGRLIYYGKLNTLVLHCNLAPCQSTLLMGVQKGAIIELKSLAKKNFDSWVVYYAFGVGKLLRWFLLSLFFGVFLETFLNVEIIVETIPLPHILNILNILKIILVIWLANIIFVLFCRSLDWKLKKSESNKSRTS